VPALLGQLPALKELCLGNNRLTGEVPASLGQLASLWRLDLSNNQLTSVSRALMQQLRGRNVRVFLDRNLRVALLC
jgi:Leucine-rich repeat (LRR) protein